MRIVSLLPSATEIVGLLGAGDALVGRSHECDFPSWVRDRPALTLQRTVFTNSAEVDRTVRESINAGSSLYSLDAEGLQKLRPDLIITQDLCSVCSIDLESVRAIAASIDPAPRVLSLNPQSFEDVLDDILRVGEAIGRTRDATELLVALRQRFFAAADFVDPYADPVRVVFLEWTDPPFVGGHWTPQLIERAGGAHPLNPTRPLPGAGAGAGAQGAHRVAGLSVQVTTEAIAEAAPEALIVCPCGLDLAQTRIECAKIARKSWWKALPAVREGRVALVDGSEMFNRPGPRLVDAYEWLVGWLNDLPHLIPEGFPWEPWE